MRYWIALVALLATSPACASASDAAGRWAVRSGGRVLMMVTLEMGPAGWRGAWQRPRSFGLNSNFQVLKHVSGPTVEGELLAAAEQGDTLLVTFAGRTPGDFSPRFTFTPSADGTARMSPAELPGAALVLDRAAPTEQPIAPDEAATYPVDQHWRSSPEMAAIFAADQADRSAGVKTDWTVVDPRDLARRRRTKQLIDSGALASGDDFHDAAFVFQHGSEPRDYLYAHVLAMIAMARGRPDASWIAAATLDRYLRSIGQKQIFGSQFGPDGSPTPNDSTLLSDALLGAVGMPVPVAPPK